MDHVVLVDEHDNAIGTMEKMEAHRTGTLHRAFSVLLFNSRGELLLQKRARSKYHSGGLWTNTCCSHPLPDERIADAARRKLIQEMGIDLKPEFYYKFIYRVQLEENLTEHEYDHVFVGSFDGQPSINLMEVEDWRYCDLTLLKKDIEINPVDYSHWFKLILNHAELDKLTASSSR